MDRNEKQLRRIKLNKRKKDSVNSILRERNGKIFGRLLRRKSFKTSKFEGRINGHKGIYEDQGRYLWKE